jgi:hypothetical protein
MLLEPSSSSTTVPGIAETQPPAAEHPMPATDVNLSRSDAQPPQHLPIPESDAPADDVLLINRLNSLCILKPILLRLKVLTTRLESSRHLQSSKVPSSRIGRLFHHGSIYLRAYLPASSPSSGFSKGFQTARSSSRTIQHLQQTPIPPCVGRRITLSTCSGYLRSFNAFACRSPWRASSVISIHHEFIPHFLHSHPAPFLSPAQLVPLCITAADIMLALKEIQPSAQREALRLCLMSHGRTLVRCTRRTASWTWPS